MLISDEDREWIDARADQLFRENERARGGVRPATITPQDYRDYFVVQAAWERAAYALIEAERRGAERMRDRAAAVADSWLENFGQFAPKHLSAQSWANDAMRDLAEIIRALPLTEETPDSDAE